MLGAVRHQAVAPVHVLVLYNSASFLALSSVLCRFSASIVYVDTTVPPLSLSWDHAERSKVPQTLLALEPYKVCPSSDLIDNTLCVCHARRPIVLQTDLLTMAHRSLGTDHRSLPGTLLIDVPYSVPVTDAFGSRRPSRHKLRTATSACKDPCERVCMLTTCLTPATLLILGI